METITEFNKKVYKIDSAKRVRILHVYTEGADLIQESGLIDGEKVVHRSTCVGKNIGKANETTPEEQARLEAASKIETKMSTGYFNSVQEALAADVVLPMLAKDFKKESKKVKYPCYVQPKLDGMRALGAKDTEMISRKGKAIDTMAHIQKVLDDLVIVDTLDGELYAHGISFQENMKLIKKYREGETENVKYHVYDMVLPNMGFASRYALLRTLFENGHYPHIELVPTYQINNEQELKEYHKQFLAEGYEGTIVRHGEDGYAVNKRATQLLKYKDFIDIACEVVDVVPSDKNPEQGVVHCKNDVGSFGCGMKFSHAEREEILKNKDQYIGKTAEIRFFEYTDDGLPRFPVCIGFRLDK